MRRFFAAAALTASMLTAQPAAAQSTGWAEEFLALCTANRPDMWPAVKQARAAGYRDMATEPRPDYAAFAIVRKGEAGSTRVLSVGTQIISTAGQRVSHCRLEARDPSTSGDRMIRDWIAVPSTSDEDGVTEFFFAEDRTGRRLLVDGENFKASIATYGGVSLLTIKRDGDRVEAILSHVSRLP